MSADKLKAGLEEEMARLSAEEQASASKAEKAADPMLQPPTPPPGAPPPGAAEATMNALGALPPQLVTPLLITALDLIAKRVAQSMGGEAARERFALRPDEHAQLVQVWTPIVQLYLPLLQIHPLGAAVGITALTYGLKALPEGGLEAVLAGIGGGSAPQAEVSTADLLKPPPPPSTPTTDPVIAEVNRKAAELRAAREAEASKAAA